MVTVDIAYQRARDREYDVVNRESKHDFHKDMEEAFEMGNMPEPVKSKIHHLAYEGGHSAGHYEMITHYFDLVDLAKLCLVGK